MDQVEGFAESTCSAGRCENPISAPRRLDCHRVRVGCGSSTSGATLAFNPVLQVRVSWLDLDPTLGSYCPGYESSVWRDEALVRDVFDRHLASFALPYSEFTGMDDQTSAPLLRKAAKAIYNTEKYAKRGEFGELFLHAISRDFFDSQPAISKIAFKDSPNDTVKGFDHVHVVEIDSELELWLGEVKFYADLNSAIDAVTSELQDHLSVDYLRREFVAIVNKLDPAWPHSDAVKSLLDENTSLDEVFDVVTVPVLLTYESPAVAGNHQVCDAYIEALEAEALAAWERFSGRCDASWPVRLRLLLMPLRDKQQLIDRLHEKLEQWQLL